MSHRIRCRKLILMDKFIVLVDKRTGKPKYFLGKVKELKMSSYPGYEYHGAFNSLAQARFSAAVFIEENKQH